MAIKPGSLVMACGQHVGSGFRRGGTKRAILNHVRFWHKTDIETALSNVRYWG
jgi:hypothetical protein